MKQLDIIYHISLDGKYSGEDQAFDIDFSNSLYNKLKRIYIETCETDIQIILNEGNLTPKQRNELEKIVQELKDDFISNQDSYNPETGEEYDFSEFIIDMEVDVPDEWDEE